MDETDPSWDEDLEPEENEAVKELLDMAAEIEPSVHSRPKTVLTMPEKWQRGHPGIRRDAISWEKAQARRDHEMMYTIPTENDNPKLIFQQMNLAQKNYAIAKLALEDGMTAEDLRREYGLSNREITQAMRVSKIDIRMAELEMKIRHSVLKKKGPALKAITGLSLAAILEWLVKFFEEERHLEMKVQEASQFTKIIKDIYELSRVEAGKPTKQVEVIRRAEKDVNIVLEKLTSANVEQGGDPFRDYVDKGKEETVKA